MPPSQGGEASSILVPRSLIKKLKKGGEGMRRETDWQRQKRIEREEAERARVTRRYGPNLGMALYEYAYNLHTDPDGEDGSRAKFALIVESMRSDPDLRLRIRATEALLEAFENKLGQLASKIG